MLSKRVILHCFLRTIGTGAIINLQGQQNIGFLHALEPALHSLYKDADSLASARERHFKYILTNSHMAPLLVGMLLSLECLVAKNAIAVEAVSSLKETMSTTLSAIGDSFFNGSLLTFWSIGSIVLILYNQVFLVVFFSLLMLLAIMCFRATTFFLGLKQGLLALNFIKYINLINFGDKIKCVNAFLLAIAIFKFVPVNTAPLRLNGIVLAFTLPLLLAFFIAKAQLIRVLILLMLLTSLQFTAIFDVDFWIMP